MGKGMKAGKKPSAGKANNMQAQLAKLQAIQRQMEQTQAELDEKEITATAGGGAVSVTVSGKKELTKVELKPEVVDPDDIEMLQDLILAATNEALRQVEEMTQNEMSKYTNGLGF